MAKEKQTKIKGVPNKHLHARTAFLYQAATYLTLRGSVEQLETQKSAQRGPVSPTCSGLALQLASDLHTVSRKGQVRLSSDLKRTICKTCYTALIPGRTATQTIENESKGGKKSWADVLVILCTRCGTKKRFPVGVNPQKKKSERKCSEIKAGTSGQSGDAQLPIASASHVIQDPGSTPK